MQSIYESLLVEVGKNQVGVLKTILHSTNHVEKSLVPISDPQAVELLKKGEPQFISNEETLELIEPFYQKSRLIVLGGGHIALPLVRFASETGFLVTVVDDRPTFANIIRFKEAKEVLCIGFEELTKHLTITPYDYVVIITRGHRHDKVCLEQLAKGEQPYYVGMIGSRRRVKGLMELLMEEGMPKERIEQVHTPIGLDIGGITPPEIAISILSELILYKRKEQKKINQYQNHSDVDYEVIEQLSIDKEEKAIVTIVETKGSVPRHKGAKMLVYPDGRIIGSIGGGCSESAVIGTARGLIGSGRYKVEEVDMTGDVAEEEGMVCGGKLWVLIEG